MIRTPFPSHKLHPSRDTRERGQTRVALRLIIASVTLLVGSTWAAGPAHADAGVIATITGIPEPMGVSVSPDGSEVWVASFNPLGASLGATGGVYVIDTSTNTLDRHITSGLRGSSVGVTFTADGSRAYVTDNGYFDGSPSTGVVRVVDTATDAVTSSIVLGDREWQPNFVALSPDGSTGYTTVRGADSNAGTIVVFDTGTNGITDRIALGDWQYPWALSITPDGSRLYVANYQGDSVSVIDTTTNTVVDTITGMNGPTSVAMTSDGMRVYVTSTFTDELLVIRTSDNQVIETLAISGGPNAAALSLDDAYLYVPSASNNTVSMVRTSDLTVVNTFSVGSSPDEVALSRDGSRLYVTNFGSDTVSVIDTGVRVAQGDTVPGPVTYFSFVLADGRECTAISPKRVQVGSMVDLPGVDALCHTMPGSTVAGWTIPVPQGFTGYGSAGEPFPPGLMVRVIESQTFTLVPFEPILQIDYDANIATVDTCTPADIANTSDEGRIAHVWVPRADFLMARTPSQAPCTPAGHRLTGWNTAGDGTGESLEPGAPLPQDWADGPRNLHRLYAQWSASAS